MPNLTELNPLILFNRAAEFPNARRGISKAGTGMSSPVPSFPTGGGSAEGSEGLDLWDPRAEATKAECQVLGSQQPHRAPGWGRGAAELGKALGGLSQQLDTSPGGQEAKDTWAVPAMG